ncbi:glycosyltransferase [uncultured Bacteroides sp.]|uniref:glycosyltransferase n=1 Tax=uncultured Bacteroides sp. TaxID=162156 RepID=UPI002AAB3CF2|nr:glycosyltransferase [uncultured Bacteroides sp.]
MSDLPKKIRILQLPSWYLPEGGQFCRNQSLFLKERGIEVHILANVALSWKKYKLKALTAPWKSFESLEDGVLTYRYYYRRLPKQNKGNLVGWCNRTVKLFDEYVEKYGKPDLIHVHSSMWGGYAAYLIKEKYNIPYVITEHRGIFGMRSSFARDCFIPMYNLFLQKGFSNASYIIPVSEQLIPKIKEFLTVDVPIKTISNILDTSFFHYLPREPKENFTFVTVNGYYEVKGYDILLPAFDLLCDKVKNICLRMVGENFEQKAFQEILSRCRNKDKITFTGFLGPDDVLKELGNADAFVMSSRVEAQPVTILEAISTGLPVVCTEVVPESVVSYNEGYRIPVEDVQALAEGMMEMMINRDRFDTKKISVHADSVAGPQAVVDSLISVYKSIL